MSTAAGQFWIGRSTSGPQDGSVELTAGYWEARTHGAGDVLLAKSVAEAEVAAEGVDVAEAVLIDEDWQLVAEVSTSERSVTLYWLTDGLERGWSIRRVSPRGPADWFPTLL